MTGKAALRQSGTGQSPGDGLELVYLDVARIKPYEHNPRRAPNAEFERIKASIRVDGLGQPLVVTQRPGESDYLVHAGGNTRLRILRELFAETDDERDVSLRNHAIMANCTAAFLDHVLSGGSASALNELAAGDEHISLRVVPAMVR